MENHTSSSPRQQMFVVTAFYGSGHGGTSTSFLITPNFTDTIAAVSNQKLEYHTKFHGSDHGFSVDLLEVGRSYQRQAFNSNDGCPIPDSHPHVIFFRWRDGHLRAEWRPSVLKRLNLELPEKYLHGGFQIPER